MAVLLGCGAIFLLGEWIASRTSEPSPEEARQQVRAALATPGGLAQAELLTPLLLSVGPGGMAAVADVYEESFADGRGGVALELFVERFAALDPLDAGDRIAGWPRDRRLEAYPALFRTWARTDPGAALAALDEIADAETRSVSFPALVEGWADVASPEVLWRYLARLEQDIDRERGCQVVVRSRMLRVGAETALREIEDLPEEPALGRFKQNLLRTGVGLVARSQPDAAIAIAEAHRDDPSGDALIRRVAVNWVTQDPAAAMAWIRTQPDTAVRRRAMREAYRRWVVRDRLGAIAWMAEQRDLDGLESILDIHASALARSDPRAAIEWARGIENPVLRREAVFDAAAVWHYEDPEAAEAWLGEAGLQDAIDQRERRRRVRAQALGLDAESRSEADSGPVSDAAAD